MYLDPLDAKYKEEWCLFESDTQMNMVLELFKDTKMKQKPFQPSISGIIVHLPSLTVRIPRSIISRKFTH